MFFETLLTRTSRLVESHESKDGGRDIREACGVVLSDKSEVLALRDSHDEGDLVGGVA